MEERATYTLTGSNARVTEPRETGPSEASRGLRLCPESIMERSSLGEKDVDKTWFECGFGGSVGFAYTGKAVWCRHVNKCKFLSWTQSVSRWTGAGL